LRNAGFQGILWEMLERILVIRGGAIGDFVVTLPALRLLREGFPGAHIELLGYQHIVALAEGRYYADASRSIEYGPLASFFTKGGDLDEELCRYFASFPLVVSYLYDPDLIFAENLVQAGVKRLVSGPPKPEEGQYAAWQLAKPLERLLGPVEPGHPRLFPSKADLENATELLPAGWAGKPLLALHPGSGSPKKNWPAHRWLHLVGTLLEERPDLRLLVLGGEADAAPLTAIRAGLGALAERALVLEHVPLPVVAALLGGCALYLGHDSGISHIAAAVGTPCVLLFGPSSAPVWAPRSGNVSLICSDRPDMGGILPETVREAAGERLG
jgi:heptosyltransferase-3